MPRKNWTAQEDDLLKSVLIGDEPYRTVAQKHFPYRSRLSVKKRALFLGLKNPYHNSTANGATFNESFWETPNELNSYWAGFIAADGCVYKNYLCIQLSRKDASHLEKFKNDINFSKDIYLFSRKSSGRMKDYCSINVYCQKWIDDMNKNFNITPRKTWTYIPPKLDEHLMPFFLAGYFDGDGCYMENSNTKQFVMLMSSATKDVPELFSQKSRQYKRSDKDYRRQNNVNVVDKKYYRFGLSGCPAIHMAHELMSLDCPHLDRKYKKVKDYLDQYPEKSFGLTLP